MFLLPVAFALSYYNLLPINLFESILGAISGYLFLFFIAKFFALFTKKEGLGEGDIDLLSMIGSFTGIVGCWTSITIASLAGSIIGVIYVGLYTRNRHVALPFGPFLACGAIFYVFFQHTITQLFILY
jgi:leader peptidase (prepilin peptidase)/N-methyltransferase